MSTPIFASRIDLHNCAVDCPCQSVHVTLLDDAGDPIAAISLSRADARRISRDFSDMADIADAQKLRNTGRLG